MIYATELSAACSLLMFDQLGHGDIVQDKFWGEGHSRAVRPTFVGVRRGEASNDHYESGGGGEAWDGASYLCPVMLSRD